MDAYIEKVRLTNQLLIENNQLNDDEMDDIITKVLDSLDDENNNIKFLFKKDRLLSNLNN